MAIALWRLHSKFKFCYNIRINQLRIVLKTRQYSVKVLEIKLEDEDKFKGFFDKNYQFFQNHLIVIEGRESSTIKRYLQEKNMRYVFNLSLERNSAHASANKSRYSAQESVPKAKRTNLQVIDKLVRSGQELNIKGDLLLLNRVNSGGSIVIDGTLIITQIIDGSIRCNGNFMMLQASPKANIVFHGVEVDNSFLQDKLNRVELIDDEIIITPVLKETNWA